MTFNGEVRKGGGKLLEGALTEIRMRFLSRLVAESYHLARIGISQDSL